MSRLRKQPGYERRLIALAESLVGQPYTWGSTDCASLAARAIAAMTKAPELEIVARLGLDQWYHSQLGAQRAFVALGGIRPALNKLACTEHPVRYAQQGDILVIPGAEGHPLEAAAIVVSGRLLMSTEASGVHWAQLPQDIAGAVAMRL